ncbi:WD40-repeat-containing domain protein [Schizophyllum fasciatum]
MSGADTSKFIVSEAHLVKDEARRRKAEETKDLGEPITLKGVALDFKVIGNDAWVAENSHKILKLNLETGKILQVYSGHGGPVTSIAFADGSSTSGNGILISGSWDKTIKLWNTADKSLISSTDAHSDFVKTLFVVPSLNLLVSGGSDKIVRLWDLTSAGDGKPLTNVGSLDSHTRPIQCLHATATSDSAALLYTADTMGIIRLWQLTKEAEASERPHWRFTLKREFTHHRTGVNDLHVAPEYMWTASTDDTVQLVPLAEANDTKIKPPPAIAHPAGVKAILPLAFTPLAEPYLFTAAEDVIRVYDVSTPNEPELINQVDAHWHNVTLLRLWIRRTVGEDGQARVEPWLVSASLDKTLRKWRLSELLNPAAPKAKVPVKKQKTRPEFQLSAAEEAELDELLDSD